MAYGISSTTWMAGPQERDIATKATPSGYRFYYWKTGSVNVHSKVRQVMQPYYVEINRVITQLLTTDQLLKGNIAFIKDDSEPYNRVVKINHTTGDISKLYPTLPEPLFADGTVVEIATEPVVTEPAYVEPQAVPSIPDTQIEIIKEEEEPAVIQTLEVVTPEPEVAASVKQVFVPQPIREKSNNKLMMGAGAVALFFLLK